MKIRRLLLATTAAVTFTLIGCRRILVHGRRASAGPGR